MHSVNNEYETIDLYKQQDMYCCVIDQSCSSIVNQSKTLSAVLAAMTTQSIIINQCCEQFLAADANLHTYTRLL